MYYMDILCEFLLDICGWFMKKHPYTFYIWSSFAHTGAQKGRGDWDDCHSLTSNFLTYPIVFSCHWTLIYRSAMDHSLIPCQMAENYSHVSSGNQTWQWKMNHLSVILPIKPPFIGAMFDETRGYGTCNCTVYTMVGDSQTLLSLQSLLWIGHWEAIEIPYRFRCLWPIYFREYL